MKRWLTMTFVAGLCMASLLLQGCSSDGDDKNVTPVNITEQQAQDAMITNILGGFNSSLDSIDTKMFNAPAMDMLMSNPQLGALLANAGIDVSNADSIADLANQIPLGDLQPFLTALSGKPSGKATALSKSFASIIKPFTKPQTRAEAEPEMTDAEVAAQIEGLLSSLFNPPVRVGNTITYTLKDQLCQTASEGEQATAQEIAQCKLLLSKLALVQTLLSETSGTVSLIVDGAIPITIGYSTTEVYVELDLGETKTAVEKLSALLESFVPAGNTDATAEDLLPSVLEGAIRLTLGTPSETSATIKVGITKAININDATEGDEFKMTMASSNNMFEIAVNDNSASLSVNVGALSVTMTDPDDTSTPPGLMSIALGGITTKLSFDATGENLSITDTAITDALTVSYGASANNMDEAIVVMLDSVDLTISSTDSSITFDSALDFMLEANNVDGKLAEIFDGDTNPELSATLAIAATKDTQMTWLDVAENEPFIAKVLAGSFTVTGTGVFEGSLAVSEDECMTEGTTFLIETIACP